MGRPIFSWDKIVETGKQHNKTVLCEVEKRGMYRYFKVKCNVCKTEGIKSLSQLSNQCDMCIQLKWQDKNKLTKEFIDKAKKIHGEKYNYDITEYINISTKIKIYCNRCDEIFMQTPSGHLQGYGCRKCGWIFGHEKIRSTTEEFIIKAIKIHNNKFDYDLVQYKNSLLKVQIKCNECKTIFLQSPNDHLNGYGCKKCADEKMRSNTQEFIMKAVNLHGDSFNYDLVSYLKSGSKVKIKCNNCNNIFLQTPAGHLNLKQSVCFKCFNSFQKLSTEEWILRAEKIHQQKFDYNLVEYKNSKCKVHIKCKKCNDIFIQRADHHLRGYGCPFCKESKGEIRITRYLVEKNMSFIPQKTFITLRDKNPLLTDFYLDDLNLLIEYDGEGHYFAVFGTTLEEKQKNFEDCQRRDKIKNEWAKANNIPLLRIPYWDFDRIEELIEAFILQHTGKKETKQLVLEI